MTLTQKWLYLKPTRNSFCTFFPAKDIVSYREFISSPLHVRLKQLCPTHGPVEGFVRPILSLTAVICILHTDNHFLILIIFNLLFLMQAVLSTTLNRGITRGAQFPGRPVIMGALNDYSSGSQPGCRGTLGCHLQYPGVPRANTFFIISLKRYFQNVAKAQSKLLWVRH